MKEYEVNISVIILIAAKNEEAAQERAEEVCDSLRATPLGKFVDDNTIDISVSQVTEQ